MRRVLLLAGFVLIWPVIGQADFSTSSLTSNPNALEGGIYATGAWATDPWFKISWSVTQLMPDAHGRVWWKYQYGIANDLGGDLGKEVSHVLIQVSGGAQPFTTDDVRAISGVTSWELGTYPNPGQSSNPGLPGEIYALNFEFSGKSVQWSFETDRAPQWADFYAKDGVDKKTTGDEVYAYNYDFGVSVIGDSHDLSARAQGFRSSDPATAVDLWKIVAPDTVIVDFSEPVPAPAAVMLGLLGMGCSAWIRRSPRGE